MPVLTGTAFKNKGVQPLLDAVNYYMPAPTDVEAIKGTDLDGEKQMTRKSSDTEPFAALAFKVRLKRYSRPGTSNIVAFLSSLNYHSAWHRERTSAVHALSKSLVLGVLRVK